MIFIEGDSRKIARK